MKKSFRFAILTSVFILFWAGAGLSAVFAAEKILYSGPGTTEI